MAHAKSGVSRFYLVLGGLALLGVIVLVWQMSRPKSTPIRAGVPVEVTDTSGFRGYLLGSDSAAVEITEYADYQCPVCRDFELVQFPTVRRQLIETGLVRWRYRDYPLDAIHPHARLAAHAAACANDQGKYWDMHAMIYERHPEWYDARSADGHFREYASAVGLNTGTYDTCMQEAKYAGRIEASAQEGNQVGVGATPTFLIGGNLYPGILVSDSMRKIVQGLLPKSGTPPTP